MFPPFLEVVAYLEKQEFREIIVATPGPMGVLALLSARLLNIRCSVLAQPQVPDYVNQMTDDPNFELMAENYLDWFYDQADRVFCQSPAEKQRLVAQGVTAECLDQSGIDDPSKAKAAALEAEVV